MCWRQLVGHFCVMWHAESVHVRIAYDRHVDRVLIPNRVRVLETEPSTPVGDPFVGFVAQHRGYVARCRPLWIDQFVAHGESDWFVHHDISRNRGARMLPLGRATSQRTPQLAAIVAWWMLVLFALWFLRRDAQKYFEWSELGYLRFWPQRGLLAVHVAGAGVALLAGPLQFIPTLRKRLPRFHRALG